MLIDIVVNPKADHQLRWGGALARGLARHGIRPRTVHSYLDARADVVACWGWRQGRLQRAKGRRVLVLEAGYVGDRERWVSLGWDGLNGRARFPVVDDAGIRWCKHFDGLMRQRRAGGDYALVLGQVGMDAAIEGVNIQGWYGAAAVALACCTGLPVRFRPHPVELQRRGGPHPRQVAGMDVLDGDLAAALAGAGAVAAYNSNSLTDAALAGLQLLAGDAGAMAWPIAGQHLEDGPLLGRRGAWAHRLAWCQWTEDEVASGAAWAVVSTVMDPAAMAEVA